jgi:putative ABC transport system permease protein
MMALPRRNRSCRTVRPVFFLTYLRRELSRRMRQAVFIALGLALGVGLVVTVSAASAGFKKAQTEVLNALYGVGTDVTVTGAAITPKVGPPPPGGKPPANAQILQPGPNGWQVCSHGKCVNVDGTTQDNMNTPYNVISASKVEKAARLNDVATSAGGLSLLDQWQTFPKSGTAFPESGSYWLDGVDVGHLSLGPLNGGTITAGHSFTSAEADSAVALVDSGYAAAHGLKAGSALVIGRVKFTVIGIISQPQEGGNPTDIYVPLARAQAISLQSGTSAKNEVNTIYLAATSSADISTVSKEISGLLPGATVTTASSLANDVTGSVANAEKLVNDLGKWLSVLVLIAAFVVACLLTMAAVTRRVREFGTLKAIGWRSRRIVAQVLGESAAMGVIGAAVGVGLGFAGAAVIAHIAPKLPATIGGNNGPQVSGPGGGQAQMIGGASLSHSVVVPVHPSVGAGVIVLAVILAVAGGLLAGTFGSWRIAGLRPADALSRVG